MWRNIHQGHLQRVVMDTHRDTCLNHNKKYVMVKQHQQRLDRINTWVHLDWMHLNRPLLPRLWSVTAQNVMKDAMHLVQLVIHEDKAVANISHSHQHQGQALINSHLRDKFEWVKPRFKPVNWLPALKYVDLQTEKREVSLHLWWVAAVAVCPTSILSDCRIDCYSHIMHIQDYEDSNEDIGGFC